MLQPASCEAEFVDHKTTSGFLPRRKNNKLIDFRHIHHAPDRGFAYLLQVYPQRLTPRSQDDSSIEAIVEYMVMPVLSIVNSNIYRQVVAFRIFDLDI